MCSFWSFYHSIFEFVSNLEITDLLHSRRYDEAPSKGALC